MAEKLRRLTGIGRLYPVRAEAPTEVLEDAQIQLAGEEIRWVGPSSEAPPLAEGEERLELNGATVTPGWIDPHTHLIWAGSRQHEFRMRMEGHSYLDIARAGGGIMSTVRQVRKTPLEELVALGRQRLERFLSFGVTSIEVKSGYGLSTEAELKMLQAARQLADEGPLDIATTFLGAHTIPTEYKQDREAYVALVCEEMIPEVQRQGLAEYCDIFVEESAFSLDEARRVLGTGMEHGLGARIHADQLSAGGGGALAAELGAVSADHLEEIDEEDIHKMAEAGVVACLIPGSTFCLRQKKYAPARALLDAGVTVTLSTDLNPGTTCSENLALIGTLACVHMGLTPIEVLQALTLSAARSLRWERRLGSIAAGFQADLTVFNAPDIDYIFYHYGISHVRQVFKRGAVVWEA